MELIFDPPLEKDVDYMLNTRFDAHAAHAALGPEVAERRRARSS